MCFITFFEIMMVLFSPSLSDSERLYSFWIFLSTFIVTPQRYFFMLLVLLYSCRWCDSRKAKAIMVEALKKNLIPFFVLKCVSLEENLSIRIIGLGLKVSDTFFRCRKFFEKFFIKIKSWYNFLLRVIWRKFFISLKIDLPTG